MRTVSAASLLFLAACSSGSDPPRRPNLVLVSIDTLRADHLSCYGYERETSPRIDALAADGVLVERAVSTTSWTLPAHLTMLTGLDISVHGICDERLWDLAARPEGPPLPLRGTFLAELLQRRGYATGGFFTWKYLETRFGFGAGFDVWERLGHSVYSHPEWKARFHHLQEAGELDELRAWQREQPELFDQQRPTAAEATDRALAWLGEQSADEPFFLFLHLFDVHDDYAAPAPYERMFDPDYEGPIDGRNVASGDSPVRYDMDPRDLAHLIARYDGEIAWVDSQVGRVVDALEEAGLADDTLIVVTSDHGEEFFEHGHKTHRTHLHKESVHVPLVLRWPNGLPRGRSVGGTAGLVDLLPTVCSLLDVPAPAALSGVDLSAELRGEAAPGDRDYLSELVVFRPDGGRDLLVSLHGTRDHAIHRRTSAGEQELRLYDLEANADEVGDGRRIEPGSAEASDVAERIDALRRRALELRAASPPRDAEVRPLTAEEWAELEKMGYTGGTAEARGSGERLCLDGCVWFDR